MSYMTSNSVNDLYLAQDMVLEKVFTNLEVAVKVAEMYDDARKSRTSKKKVGGD